MYIIYGYFILPIGTYIVDYEMSLGSAGSIALYTGTNVAGLAVVNNSIAGSTTATSWIHGRHIVVASSATYLTVSSVEEPVAVVTAGTSAGNYIARITFLFLLTFQTPII